MQRTILLVGHSDTMLMPLCAAVLNARIAKKGWAVTVRSCGFWARDGQLASQSVLTAAGELGLDLSTHRAHYVTGRDLETAWWIVPQDDMIARGLQTALKKTPDAPLRKPLGLAQPQDTSVNTLRQCRALALAACDKLMKKLAAEEKQRRQFEEAVCLRPAEEKDIPLVARMEQACFAHPWTEENVRGELEKKDGCFLIARHGETPVGYASVAVVCGVGYINNVAVLPAFRGLGVGDRLVTALVHHCAKQNAESITLEVRSRNRAAVSLYQKHGFRVAGIRPLFYRDPPDDACIMNKPL